MLCVLLFSFVFCCLFFSCFFFVFGGGFQGSGEVARRATSLGPKPSLFVCFVILLFFSFLSLLLSEKNRFSPKKGIFCLFLSVSLCFSWAVFDLPLVQFLFLCLSLVLFFLPSCLSFLLFFWLLLFFSLSFFFCLLCFCFMKNNNIKLLNCKVLFFFRSCVFFFRFLSCLLFEIPFSYLCFFCWFSVLFLFNINVFGFKKHKLKNISFWSNGGLQQKHYIYNLCLAKCEKLCFFGPFFGQFLVDVQKHYKIGISAH